MGYLRLECSKCNTINSYHTTSNAGLNPILEIYSQLVPNGTKINSRALIQFSLSALDRITTNSASLSSNTISAYLRLYNVFSEDEPIKDSNFEFYRVDQEWDEGFGYDTSTSGSSNWVYRKENTLWSSSGGAYSSVFSTLPSNDYADFKVNIKQPFNHWLTADNYGVIVKLDDASEAITGSLSAKNFYTKKIFGRLTNTILKPFIEILWNDKFSDDINFLYFGSSAQVYFYNKIKGKFTDIDGINNFPGYLSLTGNGIDTSQTGSASSITAIIHSSITGLRTNTGIYKFNIPDIPYGSASCDNFYVVWTITSSLSSVINNINKSVIINSPLQNNANDFTNDFKIAISNFKENVNFGDILKYNLFIKRKSAPLQTLTASSTSLDSFIVTNGFWKLIDERTGIDMIPYQEISYNDTINFFEVDTNNLIPKRPYRFVFKFIEDDNVFIYDYPEYYYTFYLDD